VPSKSHASGTTSSPARRKAALARSMCMAEVTRRMRFQPCSFANRAAATASSCVSLQTPKSITVRFVKPQLANQARSKADSKGVPGPPGVPPPRTSGRCKRLAASTEANLTSYWNERKAHETGVLPISSGYTLGFWRGREERCQAQFL
jgi:hypothetical protein